MAAATFFSGNVAAQQVQLKRIRPNAPPPDQTRIYAVRQEMAGSVYHLEGDAEIETSEMLLQADRIDYDETSGNAEARGNVRFEHFVNGEKIRASRVEYNVNDETGKFYDVTGTSPAKIDARPGILTTSNPFYFSGSWAERIENKYVLYDAVVTDCKMPGGWWVLRAPKINVFPGDHAIAFRSVFWLKRLPLFYAPALYKSLKRMPRKSGFLTPNVGNSSRLGTMVGWGYYWAINRSYDATYRQQYFSQRGFAHHLDFRGKPRERTDFDAVFYGVADKGARIGDTVQKQGGWMTYVDARSYLGRGWEARAQVNYLSSFLFRQNFTQSFHEAVTSESHSTAYVDRHWRSFALYGVFDYGVNFQSTTRFDRISIRKLPEAWFVLRERPITKKVLPLYLSVEASGGLLRRAERTFETRQFVERADFVPTVRTAFQWKGFHLAPSFGLRATGWGSSVSPDGQLRGQNVYRNARDFALDLSLPPVARIFDAPRWTRAAKLKHVIETRASYRNTSGVLDFNRMVLFDATELVSNTNELELAITNRFFTKGKSGNVHEAVSWTVMQKRYFDPTFGGAVVPGRRNVVLSVSELTGYTFLDQLRSYSPVVSIARVNTRIGMEWRADYDPLRGHITNSAITADYRQARYWLSAGHNQVRNNPVLGPSSNQFRGMLGLGNENRRGWNAGFSGFYDYKKRILQYATTQVTYNTDCCGFSVQYRRMNFGTVNDHQFFGSFAIANIGSVGTLKRQERMF